MTSPEQELGFIDLEKIKAEARKELQLALEKFREELKAEFAKGKTELVRAQQQIEPAIEAGITKAFLAGMASVIVGNFIWGQIK